VKEHTLAALVLKVCLELVAVDVLTFLTVK